MALDTLGNAYVTGTTNTYNFPVTQGTYQTSDSTPGNGSVGFVSKFSGSGNLQYSTYFYDATGIVTDPTAIAVDSSGSAYITGAALSFGTFPIAPTTICDPNVYGLGCNYAFVAKFDDTAATLLYSTFLGPNNDAVPQAIALDGRNDAYILAYTGGGLFSTVNGIEQFNSGNDILLVEIDPAAGTQLFATYLGGSGNDQPAPAGMVLDADGNLYIAGTTDSTDFPVTQHAFQSGLGGKTDGFILKIAPDSLAAVTFAPSSLQYASQMIGTASQPQTVVVRNIGSAPLSISSITATGDFSETENCGTSLSAAGSCTLSIIFTPNAPGSRLGTIVIADDAAGAPHSISLSGSAIGAVVNLSPAGLSFPSTPVGTTTAGQTLTLANTGNMLLTISSIQLAGDYGQTNNCPATLPATSSCLINVSFTPSVGGVRTGAVTIRTSAAGGPQTVGLSGTGSDFRITSSSNSATVTAGTTASYSVTVASVGGTFSNAVKLSCSGAPAKTTCSLSTTSVTPGSSSAAVTITVNTTANSAELATSRTGGSPPIYALWMQLPGFGLVGLTLLGTNRRAKKLALLIALFLLVGALLFMSACAGGTGIAPQHQGTTPGTYIITVSGASGSLQHSVPLTLTVQ
jgi:hypothetical protein